MKYDMVTEKNELDADSSKFGIQGTMLPLGFGMSSF